MQPKILVLDIETAPMLVYVFELKDQNISLGQIHRDWHVMAWSAKWFGKPRNSLVYRDIRNAKKYGDDKAILKELWSLLDEADFVITQNGKNFDAPRLNARFITHGMKPPSPYKHLDTYQIIKRTAKFTSSKLEYVTDKLCTRYKKLSHKRFPGFSLWKECLAGNKRAWDEMKIYNIHDVLSTEELYTKIQAWDNSRVNFNVYSPDTSYRCNCGSTDIQFRGFFYTDTKKFRRFMCKTCGKWSVGKKNLLPKEKQRILLEGPVTK